MSGLSLLTRTSGETLELGVCLGRLLEPGDVVALTGNLGSGKTVLTKGLARGLGVPEESNVRSPSFVILNIHAGRCTLYHLDLYRIRDPVELEDLGYREIFYGEGVTVIEWGEKIQNLLPADRLEIRLVFGGGDHREVFLEMKGSRFAGRCHDLRFYLSRFS